MSEVSSPISSITPNFGIYTLHSNGNDIRKFSIANSIQVDRVDRGEFQGNISDELSMKTLNKSFT